MMRLLPVVNFLLTHARKNATMCGTSLVIQLLSPMRKTGSRYLPNYSDTLEVLQMTQAQLSDASIEYEMTDSEVMKGRILERVEALCAMREDA